MRHYILISMLFLTACRTSQPATRPQQPVRTAEQKPAIRQVNDKYILTTPFGHKIEVEMDYAVGQNGYINNGCKAQYITTNIGNKELREDEAFFTGAGTRINGTRFDSTYRIYQLVFEFISSDEKKIEKAEPIFRSNRVIPVGKSTEAETVRIDAGSRSCISVKPIRVEMDRGVQVGNNSKKN